ncbi:MAG: hypothetical protein MUE42_03055 [Opitutaceae bacterium]|nr:hypothetical protein [Opitutaceae bacterium]
MATIPPIPADAKAWDKARAAFAKSILVDTPLASLAQDLDVPAWPISAPDETPAAYIYLPYTQAVAALAARGLPPAQLGALITLLNDTNAFDQPFGEMMEDIQPAASGAVDADSPLIKNMAKLGLPADFPLALSGLSAATLDLCRIEKVDTLGGFVAFASRLSQAVIVGGDFRELLNALAQRDEAALARFLPLRKGAPGLHLLEGVALAARRLAPPARAAILARPAEVPPEAAERVVALVAHFSAEHAAMRQARAGGATPEQIASALEDVSLRPVVAALLAPHLTTAAAATPPPPKPSFWRRLFGRA